MKQPVVLVADDDRGMRSALRIRLHDFGYRVVELQDGLGVLREVQSGAVAAIILDHEMPNGDGRSVARMIRNESDVPIVFVSGHDREEFRQIATQLPEVYYLSKPVEAHRLRELLSTLVPVNAKRKSATAN